MTATAWDPACLRGVRVIVVEDSFVVAHSLEWLLTAHGGEVVGKAGNVAAGVELASRPDYDVAILDIRLGDDLVDDVARAARDRGARIVYLTGYSDAGLLPEDLRGYPILAKPVQREALLQALVG